MSPLLVRQIETGAAYFVTSFLALGATSVAGVDPADTHAVFIAAGAAVAGAVQATVQHYLPFLTRLTVGGNE